MSINPRTIPWAMILAIPGALIGFLAGGAQWPRAQGPALVGLVAGCSVGMVVHILLRIWIVARTRRKGPES